MKHLSKNALVAGVAVLSVAASAASANAAYTLTSSPGGPEVAAGTPFAMTSKSWSLVNPSNGLTVSNCTNAVLSGTTGQNATLRIESGDMTGCKIAGSTVSWKPVFDAPWQATTPGVTTPGSSYQTVWTGVKYKIGPCTYLGSLSPIHEENGDAGSVTRFVLDGAGTLTRTACTSSFYPVTIQVRATFTLATVGGAPATPSNDLVVAGP